ncbi:phosphoribosylglycinamide formyltransferase [Streptomyces sp. NRRL F-5123]|uniref:phosphoribosylglycinamide formyltransferase n=1 Tax=Streptomyces sp. NRRL F-5123 TaxID=1463856 RepID=UPI0005B7CC4C|nr:phosphoribosylglycinamide formyltransferase [Streptomyces sp. NRRL F-5123]
MTALRVAVLVSHTGSNLRALYEASKEPAAGYEIALVISNNSGSRGLAFARGHGIPAAHLSGRTHLDPGSLDDAVLALLDAHRTDLVVTAGYMKKVGPRTLAAYAGRIVNVHPALLPRHGGPGMYGAAVHQAVLDSGDRVTGPSVHYVTAEYDAGEVIARREVPVLPDDTAESLAGRVLEQEHLLLPAVVRAIAAERTDPGRPS